MSIQLFLKVYNEYWEEAQKNESSSCQLLSYDKYKLEKSVSHIYDSMECEYTRELLNTINQFSSQINSIEIWDNVISNYSDDEQFELRFEFLKLPLFYCLNQPKTIKDRMIFCVTHLCNQANNIFKDAKDDLPEDYKLGYKHFKKKIEVWQSGSKLKQALEKLASKEYNKKTKNYRNMSHHRIPVNLEYGHTNMVTRIGYTEKTFEFLTIEEGQEVKKKKTSKGISYGFGGLEPLTSSELLPIFIEQFNFSQQLFTAYWELILEHQRQTKS